MFSSVNIMFSMALAFITWVILCYFKLIEENRMSSDYQVELYTEYALAAQKLLKCPQVPNTFDNYLNLVWIFLFICALTKLIQCIDSCLNRRFYVLSNAQRAETEASDLNTKDLNATTDTENDTVTMATPICELPTQLSTSAFVSESFVPSQMPKVNQNLDANVHEQQKTRELTTQIRQLETRYSEMQKYIEELRESTSRSSNTSSSQISISSDFQSFPSESLSTVSSMTTAVPLTQNVYITNKHIHISGKVFVDERTLNINNVPQEQQPSKLINRGSEFLQIWSNFIQRPGGGTPALNCLARRNCLI